MWYFALAFASEPPTLPTGAGVGAGPALATPPAAAAPPITGAPPGQPVGSTGLSVSGELRENVGIYPNVPVDAEGLATGQSFAADQRLRLGLSYSWEHARLGTEWDLFKGQFAGDTWQIPGAADARHRERLSLGSPESFVPRRLAATVTLAPVQVVAGLQTSMWGLGMVANDGAQDTDFGRSDFGDRVLRLRVSTKPAPDSPLTFLLAGDRVLDDDSASWAAGQVAWQGVGGALYQSPDRDTVGLYGVFRDQTEADGLRRTTVGVVDAYTELHLGEPRDGGGFSVGAEAAGVTGVTSRSKSYNARSGLKVRSAGATGYVRGTLPGGRYSLTLRGGWASGDGDPDDDQSNDFTFDRDFEVGMVMFDEVTGAVEARAYSQLTDPQYAGDPPDGVDALVSEGAFRRASFGMPVLAAKPLDWLSLKAGVLVAWPTAPVAQPFYTYRNGGVPTNQVGAATVGGSLGTEVDWSLSLGDQEVTLGTARLRPAIVVQGGHLMPGADLGVEDTLHEFMITARARW